MELLTPERNFPLGTPPSLSRPGAAGVCSRGGAVPAIPPLRKEGRGTAARPPQPARPPGRELGSPAWPFTQTPPRAPCTDPPVCIQPTPSPSWKRTRVCSAASCWRPLCSSESCSAVGSAQGLEQRCAGGLGRLSCARSGGPTGSLPRCSRCCCAFRLQPSPRPAPGPGHGV